jgi:hypothetical protein
MIKARRRLACGCDRIITCEEDEVITDEDVHAGKEKLALEYLGRISHPALPLDPCLVARRLTWFYWHDDIRGVELIRALPRDELAALIRGLRSLEPEEWTEPTAVASLFGALGLSPVQLVGNGGD